MINLKDARQVIAAAEAKAHELACSNQKPDTLMQDRISQN